MLRILFVILLMVALGWAVGVRVHPEALQELGARKKVYSRKVKSEPLVTWRMEDGIFKNIMASEQNLAKKELLGEAPKASPPPRPSSSSSSSGQGYNPSTYINLARKTRDQAGQRNEGM